MFSLKKRIPGENKTIFKYVKGYWCKDRYDLLCDYPEAKTKAKKTELTGKQV